MPKHLRGSVIASVDVETTGPVARYHEIIQIAVVILGDDLKPTGDRFYSNIRPDFPERADPEATAVHRISFEELESEPDQSKVADLFEEWTKSLGLKASGRLIPLAHNWPFENSFLCAWLGNKGMEVALSLPSPRRDDLCTRPK